MEQLNPEKLSQETELGRKAASYEKLSSWQTNESLDKIANKEGIDENGFETREYGIKECTEAAERIFTPDVLDNWQYLTPEQRKELIDAYGQEAANAFGLVDYKGVIIEPMEKGVNGFNQGDGYVHINQDLVNNSLSSPLQIIDTTTHEMRHQYQIEAVKGYHAISEEVRNEWATSFLAYTNNAPWALDPWGYKYNPVEIDSRYAGESVVRNYTQDLLNA